MGLLANYMVVDDAALERLYSAASDGENLVELIDEMDEAGAEVYDIDKTWDILHFVLTGQPSSRPIENDLLSEAIVGVDVLASDDIYITVIPRDRLPVIVDALEQVDFYSLRPGFSLAALRANDIYPSLAEPDDETDSVWEQICDEFFGLRGFLKEAADAGSNIIFSIY